MTVSQPEVCVGGCLRVTAAGILEINTGGTDWQYPCPESSGQPLYCGADGILRTRPIPQHQVVSQFESFPANNLLNGGNTPWCAATIENPSDCLRARVVAFAWATARYQVTAGNNWEIRVVTELIGGDDPISVPLGAGRGAPGNGDGAPRARAITAGNSPGDGPVGREPVIRSTGDVRRVSAGGGADQENDLVQSDSPVSIRDGVIWSAAAVDTQMVAIDNGSRETGAVNGTGRPRQFTVDPGDTLTYRVRLVGMDGASGDTFSDVNLEVLLMLSTMPAVP